ncbi:PAS domain-containing protein [uncultured Pontibacter sp.]|uniref:PAS domain-containing sensor histidine kinase n=1 Tax=uncultured Pontibacter sp. TaxID=453356 RepID=UPI0026058325|nr:PAS domain-containing protein [uncultured Pontibacter sp.]
MINSASLSTETLQVFESVPDLYLIISPDYTMLTASKPYLEAALTELEGIKGKNVFDVFPDNPVVANSNATASLRLSLDWVLANKQPHKMETLRYDIPVPNNKGTFVERYWNTLNSPVLNQAGEVAYIIHKVEDITDPELAKKQDKVNKSLLSKLYQEQSITKQELTTARADAELERKKLHNLLMQAPAMICIFEGPQHVFKLVNPSYQQLVGSRPILGKPIAEAMPELAGQPIFEMLDKVFQTGETLYAYEMQVQLNHNNDGELGQNYYNFVYQATKNLEGKIDGIMVFAYEVSSLVNARQEVEKREHSLQVLNLQLTMANEEIKAANIELSNTQQALQKLNQELEERITTRTTELERAKAETETQRNRLHQLFMDAPAAICILDGPELVYELVNPSYSALFPERQLLGKPILEALPEIENNEVYRTFLEVYNTGVTRVEEEMLIPFVRPEDGKLENRYFRYVQQPRFDEHDQVDGIVAFALEITEQVEARHAAEQSAERFRLITDALPVLIGYLDKNEKYQFANKAYETWFPIKSDDLLGRPVRDVVGEAAYAGVKQYIERALAGEQLDFDAKMPYRENFVKHIRTSYVPDKREGQVHGFYTLVHDITEQAEARLQVEEREKEAQALTRKLAATNKELTSINEQLVRTNVDLDNFIYTASHDLKAPIYNIEGLVKVLIDSITEKALTAQELKRVTSMIEDSIGRFKRTIEHLTEIVKLQKENNQEATTVDIEEVINDIRLDLAPQLAAAGAQLKVHLDGCSAIHFSQKNLRSIIYNLISNAIKYSSPKRKPEIQINCHDEAEYVVLTVKDNGLGISNTGKQKLFTMFGRLHDHVEGSGIGLYMVKKIVENAYGHIEVESEAEVGSTFRVYLKK